jgi:predicted transcriptional regulator
MLIRDLRSIRIVAEISATLLAARARINLSRLSGIEHGYIQPTEKEMQRLNESLEQLIRDKAVIQRAAASVGWPIGDWHD